MTRFMKKSALVLVGYVILFSTIVQMPIVQATDDEREDFDLILRNGTIIDGTGNERYEADVGVKNGLIARIGQLDDYAATNEIDVEGKFIAPGFIDLHSHASLEALQEAKSSLTQGVTTEILSPDGGGPIDVTERFALEEDGLAINIGTYIGFNSIWKEVVGHEDRRATTEEIAEMKSLISQAMEDGAYGVSAGLFYRPAYYADTDEVIGVVRAAKEWRTNFPHHIRNENNEVVEATAETIQIGEEAGLVPVITHMKVMGPNNWGKSMETIGLIQDAIERGTYAAADVYPYLRSQTGLTAIVPPWAEEGGRSEMLKRFANPELRPQIEQEIIDIMHSRVESEADVYFPTKRMTLADYMAQVNGEAGQALLSVINFDYDQRNSIYFDEIHIEDAEGQSVFYEDFKGNDGESWNEASFISLDTWPRNPAGATYEIQDNTGQVILDQRLQGNGSAYGRMTPNMPILGDGELKVRFRVDEMGNQRLRFWLQADSFTSGSTMPVNGYGVELNLNNNQLILRKREDSSSTNVETIDANLSTDWHTLKLRIENRQVMVRLWNEEESEPEDWNIVYEMPPKDAEGNISPGEATMRILETEGSLRTIYHFGHEDDLRRIIEHSTTAIASDGGATTSDSTHPRRYGTQPRVLGKYVREKGYLEWEEAIRKMTGLPATIIGMVDRGFIAEGMVADITVFDPNTVRDYATFDQPKQYAEGIEYVIVNGELALNNGELTGVQAGQALKRAPNMPSRPMKLEETIQFAEKGEIFSIDSSEASNTFVEMSFKQDAKSRNADGFFHMVDVDRDFEFKSETIGNIQVTDGWISVTGRGVINGTEETTFSFIIDENEPLINDARPTVTIEIDGQDEIRGFLAMSAAHLMLFVDQFQDEGAFEHNEAPRHLKTHLQTVDHYKNTNRIDKAIKHLESFQLLLNNQKEQKLISEKAFTYLETYTADLIEQWEVLD